MGDTGIQGFYTAGARARANGVKGPSGHKCCPWTEKLTNCQQRCQGNEVYIRKVWTRRKHVPHGRTRRRDREGVAKPRGGTKTVGQMPTRSLEGKLHHSQITQWPQIRKHATTQVECLNKVDIKTNRSQKKHKYKVSHTHKSVSSRHLPLLVFFLVEVAHATPASW